jgi:6-pyruvoyl tetrahydropterin synthase/QueD family protein
MELMVSDKHKESQDIAIKNRKSDESKQKAKETLRKKQINTLTYDEKQVIIGSLLGDGYLHIPSLKIPSTYLILEQGIKQLNYLLWKGIRLKRLGSKFYQYYKYSKVRNRVVTRNQVRTNSMFLLGDMIPYFYGQNGKYINPEVLNHLEAPGIAIWFMDDGTTYASGGSLATQSFSIDDNNLLCEYFKNKFDILPHVMLDGNKQPTLKFDAREFDKLCNLIEPYMFYQMIYKIRKPINENFILTKRVIFDSSHFLDEYNGKCSNLHGGRYELYVSVKGAINPDTGMVLDYGYMKTILDKYIVNEFDHHCLNYVDEGLCWRSTTELLCLYIWKVLIEFFPGLYKLQLYETEGSMCEYQGPTLEDMKKDKSLEILNMFKEKDLTWRQRIITDFDTMFNNIDHQKVDIELESYNKITGGPELKKLSEILKEFKPKSKNNTVSFKNYLKTLNHD